MFAQKIARSRTDAFMGSANHRVASRSDRRPEGALGNQAMLRRQCNSAGKDSADSAKGCGCSACSRAGQDQAKDMGRDGPAPMPSASRSAPTPPPPGPAAGAKKALSLFAVSLPGSTRAPGPDIAKANTVWSQCSVGVSSAGSEKWTATNVLDQMDPKGVLNEYSSPASPTAEETAMLAHKPGGAVIHAYYVPAMSAGSRGEAFAPAFSPGYPRAVVVSDSAAVDTLAHELGHVAMGDGSHHADPDNLMASGAIRNVGVDKLDATQCGKV